MMLLSTTLPCRTTDPDPDDRLTDPSAGENTTFAHQRLLDRTVIDLCPGKETRVGIEGGVWTEEIEWRDGLGQLQIGLMEGRYGPDVSPVAGISESKGLSDS